jgi:hypothetical protein
MRNDSEKFVEKIKTHFVRLVTFSDNRAVYEIVKGKCHPITGLSGLEGE